MHPRGCSKKRQEEWFLGDLLKNALTVDLEYWWCNEYMRQYVEYEKKEQISEQVNQVLSLLEEYNTRATFFVLGELAKDKPDLIEKIFESGHEIACHSFSHDSITSMSHQDFETNIKKCLEVLGKYRIKGFRAPNFSIDDKSLWALEILERYSFEYDSSIFPIWTPLYGTKKTPLGIHRPTKPSDSSGSETNIVEFPPSVIRVGGFGIPVSGGFYLRALPFWLTKNGIKSVNQTRPGMVYFHLQDIFIQNEMIKMPPFESFQAYYGVRNGLKKLRALLKTFKFCTAGEIIEEI